MAGVGAALGAPLAHADAVAPAAAFEIEAGGCGLGIGNRSGGDLGDCCREQPEHEECPPRRRDGAGDVVMKHRRGSLR